MYLCMNVLAYVRTYVCVYVHMYCMYCVYVCVYMCMCFLCVHTYVCVHVYLHVHIRMSYSGSWKLLGNYGFKKMYVRAMHVCINL